MIACGRRQRALWREEARVLVVVDLIELPWLVFEDLKRLEVVQIPVADGSGSDPSGGWGGWPIDAISTNPRPIYTQPQPMQTRSGLQRLGLGLGRSGKGLESFTPHGIFVTFRTRSATAWARGLALHSLLEHQHCWLVRTGES